MKYKKTNIHQLIIIIVFIVTGLFIYSNIYENEFVFDDIAGIKQNPRVCLKTLSYENLKNTMIGKWPVAITEGRPVATLSFALNYYFHGYKVWGYHFVNIIIHILNGIFLYLLFLNILKLIKKKSRVYEPVLESSNIILISFSAALLWLVNPIQTQAVTYTIQRMTSLSTLFFIVSLLTYIYGRKADNKFPKALFFGVSMIAGGLALGTKENAATLPFFILLTEFYFFQDLNKEWFKRYSGYFICAFVLFTILILIWIRKERFDHILNAYSSYDFNMYQRILSEFRVVIMYLTLLVFPHPDRLHLDYNYPVSNSLLDPLTTLTSLLLVLLLIAAAVLLAKKHRLLSFSILWYFGNLVIESSFIPLDLVFEHRLYLPSVFLFPVFVLTLFKLFPKTKITISVVLVLSIIPVFWTYSRNSVWKNRLTVWEDSISKSAPKARTVNNYGAALLEEKQYDLAIAQFRRAIELNPGYAFAGYNNWGYSLLQQKQPEEAIRYFKIATNLKKDYPEAYRNWGDALLKLKRTDEAIKKYEQFLSYLPLTLKVLNRLAELHAARKDYESSIFYYKRLVYLRPDSAEIAYNLACMYSLLNNQDIAVHWLEKAINLGFRNMDTISNDKDLANIRNTVFFRDLVKQKTY